MKILKKVTAITIVSSLLTGITCSASTINPNANNILDTRFSSNFFNKTNYNCVIVSEENISNSMELLDNLTTPLFVETSNFDVDAIAHKVGISKKGTTEKTEKKDGLELKGYLIYKDNTEKIEPWYIENTVSDLIFKEDLKNRINNIISSVNERATWPISDRYSTNVTYTEAYVGVSGVQYNAKSSKATGAQDFTVQVSPRSSTYYDYSCEYYDNEIGVTSGSVLDYSPSNTFNTTQITLSYPWGVSTTINLGGKLDVSYLSGGVGKSYTKWRFKPLKSARFATTKGKSTIKFSSSTTQLKTSVLTKICLRTTDKRTGSSSTRVVNYGTNFRS